MTAALFLATIIVAFIAGMVALAMPCCFTVLLPSYLAKSFDTMVGRLGMTAVFGAGMATVLLPIAMGVSFLTTFITLNHALLFVIGGFFMVVLGLVTLWGIALLPPMNLGVDLKRKDVPSVYALGVFGGVASSCCAPVLAGVLVLTVLSGTLFSALVVGLAYVIGMVFPLLVVALAWDRQAVPTPRLLRGRMVRLHFLGHETEIHSSKLIAGSLFLAMGVFTIILGVLDRMLLNPGSTVFGIYQTSLENALMATFSNPAIALLIAGVAIAGISLGLLVLLRTRRRRGKAEAPAAGDDLPLEWPDHQSAPVENSVDTTDATEMSAPSELGNPEG
jgi:cytochrome c-type biogenesis protein